MEIRIIKLIGVLLLLPMPVDAEPDSRRPLALGHVRDLRDIRTLDREVDRLTTKIEQCAVAELAPVGQCHCQYPGKLASVKRAINQLLVRHPDWDNRALLWWDQRETYASSLHLGGIRRQLNQPCNAVVTTISGPAGAYPGEG